MTTFDQLRHIDDSPAEPDARFAAALRARVEAALTPEIELPDRRPTREDTAVTQTDTATAAPATQVLTPYITVHDGTAALQWYADAVGATETMRFTGDDGRIGHAELVVHGARIFLSDAYPEIGVVAANSYEGSSAALHLEVADCDAVHDRAVEHGATSLRAPTDQAHGSRSATVMDPYGHRWMFSQTIAEPSIADIDAATPGFTVEGTESQEPAGRPIQLGYYTIRTDDIPVAAAFYSQLFGWDVDPESGHVGNCDLPFGFQTSYDEADYRLWMKVDDPDAVVARVVELGGTVVADETYPSGRAIECRDDQGRRFDLHHPAPGYE